MRGTIAAVVFATSIFTCGTAAAEDWTATKLRGTVYVAQGQQWVKLNRGDAIPDGQPVRTTATGFVQFSRGDETIELAPNTQVQIRETRGGSYTSVAQSFGQVTIADDHTSKPHFEVDTPYIAAVVKGTVFSVKSDAIGSRVYVKQGEVRVGDLHTDLFVNITAGQHAGAGKNRSLSAGGAGALAPITNHIGDVVSVSEGGNEVVAKTSASNSSDAGGKSDDPKGKASPPGKGGPKSDGNSSAGGKGNSAGKSNSGGNGNGNSGGKSNSGGNGNSGGKGNGNSGGHGKGKN